MAQARPSSDTDLAVALHGLARFAPAFSRPAFTFAVWERPPSQQGIMAFPFCSFSSDANSFVRMAYDLGWVRDFNWPCWSQTPEAETLLSDPQRIAEATPDQLAKLLTTLIRRERFCEGELSAAFGAGVLTATAKRAAALLTALCR